MFDLSCVASFSLLESQELHRRAKSLRKWVVTQRNYQHGLNCLSSQEIIDKVPDGEEKARVKK